jgi:hypothetical protein
MKQLIIALVAVATILAVSCSKEDETPNLPGTSWALNLKATLMGATVTMNDTLNIIDDHTIDRGFLFAAAGKEISDHVSYTYTWDGKYLALFDSVGEPTSMVFTYRGGDNVFFRNADDDEEMGQLFLMMGISELTYKQIK